MKTIEIQDLDKKATLTELGDAGWYVSVSSSGSYWLENSQTNERVFPPRWFHQMLQQAYESGHSVATQELRQLARGNTMMAKRAVLAGHIQVEEE